eukprot:CAMPEP_0172726448 /NCGR_PEP_ID=MMETSP1074-20121228/90709_1 /TAXON_ID=2916 /ORGANISM="Ceratium fusus, Strain PA161109" /LENGTH=295 /DNA_ID=CAMNT_0013553463 /DNA_START=61 /DNA_END=948 /DNA_ORIENTATION=+
MTLLQGMCLVTLRALAVTVAENLQRYAQRHDPPLHALNIMGVLLGLCTSPLDMVAYSVAPQSVLAPFGMLSLILNFCVAHVHGDVFRQSDVFATLLVIAGSLTCVQSGAHGSDGPVLMPPAQTLLAYSVCIGIIAAILGSILAALRKVGGRADAFTNCLLGGVLGSSTLVAGKLIFASLVSEERTFFSVALAIIPLLTVAPVHIFVINRGYGRHPLVFMSPTLATCTMFCNVATGCLLYHEIPSQPVYFAIGVIALGYGVFSLRTFGHDSERRGNDNGDHCGNPEAQLCNNNDAE